MEASHRLVPGRETAAEWGEGDDYPVYWVNFDESELFCKTLTERARDSGGLPTSWEFRIPTEAQWEYACRAGTTTATSFGDRLGRNQANFAGKPLNGGADGVALHRASRVGSYPANPWGSLTCTATSSSGVVTGTTPGYPVEPILISAM